MCRSPQYRGALVARMVTMDAYRAVLVGHYLARLSDVAGRLARWHAGGTVCASYGKVVSIFHTQ